MKPKFEFSVTQVQLSPEELIAASTFTDANITYLRNLVAKSFQELIDAEEAAPHMRDEIRSKIWGEINLLSYLIQVSENNTIGVTK